MQDLTSEIKTTKRNFFKALLVFFVGLVVTIVFSYNTKRDVENQSQKEFKLVCNEIKTKIDARLHAHALLIRTGAALFASSDSVTRDEWKRFCESSKINKNLPGIQGLGFSVIVPKQLLPKHLKQIRKEGFADYTIKPDGNRDIYSAIIFLEPFSGRNLRAFGFDMYNEPIRRRAMELARDFDIASLSGKVTLVQETKKDVQAGALMYVPVYKNGMPKENVVQRRNAILGWCYSPYRMNDLMKGIIGQWDSTQYGRIQLQIYDTDSLSERSLLYDSQKIDSLQNIVISNRMLTIPIDFNGKKWFLHFTQSGKTFTLFSEFLIVLFGGIVTSILLFILTLSLMNTKFRAKQIAEKLTIDLMVLNEELENNVLERTNDLLQSNAALKRSELQMRTLLLTLPDMVWLKDTEGKYIYCNALFAGIFNLTEYDIIGKSDFDFLRQKLANTFTETDQTVISTSKLLKYENTINFDDDRLLVMETTKVPSFDNDGRLIGVLGIARDITEKKKTESALIESEMQISSIFDNTNDYICSIEADTFKIIRYNKSLEQYFQQQGLSIERGKRLDEILQGDVLEHWKQLTNKALQTGSFELVYTTGDNRTLKNNYNQLIKNNTIYGVSIITTDITNIVKSEKELQERNQFIESIVNLSPDTLYIYDIEEKKNIFSNKGFEETLGYNFEEVQAMGNQLISQLMHPDDIQSYSGKIIPKYLNAKDGEHIIHEYRMKDKQDNWHWIESTEIVYKRNDHGLPTQILGYGKDITIRKSIEQQILNSVIETEEKERQHFSQELHDGIGPLISASKMYVQWLNLPNPKISKEEVVIDIENLLDEAMQTVRDISFKLSPHILQNYGLHEAVKSFAGKMTVISNVEFAISAHNIVRFNEKKETIAYRAICESINNAIKHSNATKITIDLKIENNTLYVTCADNGVGFNVDEVISEHIGIGILNMQSRIKSINGTMVITSQISAGTTIQFQVKIENI